MDRIAHAQAAPVTLIPRTPPLLAAAISAVAVLGISGGAILWNHCSSDAPLADARVSLACHTVSAPIVSDAPAAVEHRPRPLSPGEFGRSSRSPSKTD